MKWALTFYLKTVNAKKKKKKKSSIIIMNSVVFIFILKLFLNKIL